jgi:hypothetical protein
MADSMSAVFKLMAPNWSYKTGLETIVIGSLGFTFISSPLLVFSYEFDLGLGSVMGPSS